MKLSTELPLYEEIRRDLQSKIDAGELREGDRIVPEIDLAKQLGVSRSTARKALQCLTDAGYISRTAGRGSFVLPRRNREGLAGSLALELAIASPSANGPGGELARGFVHESITTGYAATIWPWNENGDGFPHVGTGAAIWAGTDTQPVTAMLHAARQKGCITVLIDGEGLPAACDRVAFDHTGIAMGVTEALIAAGHRRIALVTGPLPAPVLNARIEGFRAAMRAAGIELLPNLQIKGTLGHAEALQQDLLGLFAQRDRATALVSIAEPLAPWIIEAVQRLGYVPGRDLTLALVTDTPTDTNAICARLDYTAAGRAAARMLARRMNDGIAPPQTTTIGHLLTSKG